MKNKVQLCTYADRLGKGDLSTLHGLLTHQLKGLFGGVHILPFYYPIDGADAGFDPIDHTQVDERIGDWSDIAALSKTHDVMADVIVNHMSSKSPAFQDFLKNNQHSAYADLFLSYGKVFPDGASEDELLKLYRPRPGLPLSKIKFADNTEKMLWTTFTSDQIDIDVFSEHGKAYLARILDVLEESNVTMIRLDAAGYAVKKAGTSCFMTDETFDFIEQFTEQARTRGIEILVEIHAHYLTQKAIAKKASWVYDFALPPLVLHTLIAQDTLPLQAWYKISPRNAITVLDTHDGIGIIDVATEKSVGPGLLSNQQIDNLVNSIHSNSQGNSRKATGAAASNVDLYQVNCTFFDALGSNDQLYLFARLIQFFSPGIPQVYYVGLLAGVNDMALLASTGVGRDINRHYYSVEEVDFALTQQVVKNLCALIRFRNTHPAFSQGEFTLLPSEADKLQIRWSSHDASVELSLNLSQQTFVIDECSSNRKSQLSNWVDIQQWCEAIAV